MSSGKVTGRQPRFVFSSGSEDQVNSTLPPVGSERNTGFTDLAEKSLFRNPFNGICLLVLFFLR